MNPDSDHVMAPFVEGLQKFVASAFKKKDDTLALIRCPKCKRESYAPNVNSGICTWCGYDSNNVVQRDPKEK